MIVPTMRFSIVGNAGSGKSTLAEQVRHILNLPLYHLDQYFWQQGWQRPDRAQFAIIHYDLCDKDSWIMAIRHFDYRAKQADIIVFLNVPLWRCLYRIFKRALLDYGKVRNSSAKECPERMPTVEFLRYVWKFNQKQKPVIQKLLEKYKNVKKVFVLRSRKEIDKFLSTLRDYQI